MTDKKYQKLRDVIIKNVPSIMELKFGCFVEGIKTKNIDCEELGKGMFIQNLTDKTMEILFKEETYQWEKIKNVPLKGLKIIGRQITLCDILETTKKLKSDYYFKKNVNEISGTEQIADRWDFKNNSLTSQSEETKLFLYNLLVDKK